MIHRRAFLRRWARFGALRGSRWFLAVAPILIGAVFALVLPRARRQVRRNLRRVLGRRSLGAELTDTLLTFVRFAQCLTEGMAQGRADCPARAQVTGAAFEWLETEPRGIIVLTAHLGPWDSAARELRRTFPRPLILVMSEEEDGDSAEIQDEERRADGVEVLRLGADPLLALPLLEHLRSGGVAAIQLDRAPTHRAALLGTLFEQPFAVPLGPFRLAGLAGVPLVPVFARRTGFFRREVSVGRPLFVDRRPTEAALEAAAAEVLGQLEAQIRLAPTQWFHFVPEEEEADRVRNLLHRRGRALQPNLRTGVDRSHLAKAPP